MRVDLVWWRQIQPGEFFNIERDPNLVQGGGGARYIEIPKSLVANTQKFLDVVPTQDEPTEAVISAHVIGSPQVVGSLSFLRKAGGRMRIANQNRQATPDSRHPAWRAENGFPKAVDNVKSSEEAKAFYPQGGLRIFIVRTTEFDYYAGFNKGFPPEHLAQDHWTRRLYSRGAGGLFNARGDL